jgi:hypothetical protein
MFALSSTAIKVSALVISTFAALSSMDSIAVGFHLQEPAAVIVATPAVTTLPTVTIVGRRVDVALDTVQTASQKSANTAL